MQVGDVTAVTEGACENLSLIETGMYEVTGYGGVYVLDAERPAMIETGIGTHTDQILDALEELGLAPADIEVIALTHVHLDHAGGAGFLAEACENATVVVHERGADHLVDPEALVTGTKRAVGDQWEYYADPQPIPEDRIRALEGGDTVDLGNHRLVAHHAPGHAPHQVIYHDPTMEAVFTGDAAGLWISAWDRLHQTTPPPQFDLDQAVADLDTIRNREPSTLLFTHFGPAPYRDSLLDDYETLLAEWVRDVDAVLAETQDEDAVVEHFVERTDLDEIWGERKARAETRVNVAGVLAYLDRIWGED